jgi:hypothetical protein
VYKKSSKSKGSADYYENSVSLKGLELFDQLTGRQPLKNDFLHVYNSEDIGTRLLVLQFRDSLTMRTQMALRANVLMFRHIAVSPYRLHCAVFPWAQYSSLSAIFEKK